MFARLNDALPPTVIAAISWASGFATFTLGTFSIDDIASICGIFATTLSTAYLLWKWRKEYRAGRDNKAEK